MKDVSAMEIVQAMREQWVSMTGMASMFIGTILIGLFIQPVYNFDEIRAFGESGSTKVGFILFELLMIFLFTIIIIWMARKGLDYLIKGFVMFALGISLFYTIWPVALILRWLILVITDFDASTIFLNIFALKPPHKPLFEVIGINNTLLLWIFISVNLLFRLFTLGSIF